MLTSTTFVWNSGSQPPGTHGKLGIKFFFAAHYKKNKELKFITRVHLFLSNVIWCIKMKNYHKTEMMKF
jgi:hypothetical protein